MSCYRDTTLCVAGLIIYILIRAACETFSVAVAAVIRAFPFVQSCCLKAKFHYTGPTGPDQTHANPRGPARTLSETRTDPTEFLGDPAAKKSVRVRAGPVTPVGPV